MRDTTILCVSAVFVWLSALCYADGDRFVVPADDLPTAKVAGFRVGFTRNGGFVVSKDGWWLFDGGLGYAVDAPPEEGTQVQQSGTAGNWRLQGTDDHVLITDGILLDGQGAKRFRFTQRTEIIPGGLRFRYEVTPVEKRPVREFGLTLHFPEVYMRDARAQFWPGFAQAALPKMAGPSSPLEASARAIIVYASDEPRVAVVGQDGTAWQLFDERSWRLNAYRLIARDVTILEPLREGKTAALSFEVLLGDGVARTVPLENGHCELDRYGRLSVGVAGGKLIEGGMMTRAPSTHWLYGNSEAAYDCKVGEGEGTVTVSGTANADRVGLAYDLELRAQRKLAVARYRIHSAQAGDTADAAANVRVGFAIMKSSLVSPPVLDNSARASLLPAPKAEGPRTVNLTCLGNVTITLDSDADWGLMDSKLDGTDCYLLTTGMCRQEGGFREASVRIAARNTQ